MLGHAGNGSVNPFRSDFSIPEYNTRTHTHTHAQSQSPVIIYTFTPLIKFYTHVIVKLYSSHTHTNTEPIYNLHYTLHSQSHKHRLVITYTHIDTKPLEPYIYIYHNLHTHAQTHTRMHTRMHTHTDRHTHTKPSHNS